MPFWTSPWLPLTDLPLHLGAASVLRHHADPRWGFAEHFVVEWSEPTPYWALYLALDALSLALPVETAARVYLSLLALAFPFAAVHFCRAFGGRAGTGLLAAPLFLGTCLYFGFVAYVTGIALALAGLALVEDERRAPRAGRAALLSLTAVVLFFTHAQAFALFLAAAVLGVLIARPRAPRALLPLLPGAALLAAWTWAQFVGARTSAAGRYNFGPLGRTGARFRSPGESLAGLPDALAGSFRDGTDVVLLAAWAGLMAALCLRHGSTGERARRAALPLLALAAYFCAPFAVTGQWYIAPRFAFPAALFALLLVPASAPPRAAAAAALLLTALASANAVRQHRLFAREAAGFEDVIAALPARPRVLGLIGDPDGRVMTHWPYAHFAQYAMVRKGGVASRSLATSPPFPLHHPRPADYAAPDVFRPRDFDPATHGRLWELAVVRGDPPPALPRVATLLARAGTWSLWRLGVSPGPGASATPRAASPPPS